MASRVPLRSRVSQRNKNADENATSKLRQTSTFISTINRSSIHATKLNVTARRPVLNEVTTTAVNRKNSFRKPEGKGKVTEVHGKRSRSSSVVDNAPPQRKPLAPVARIPVSQTHTGSFRVTRPQHAPVVQRVFRDNTADAPIVVEDNDPVMPQNDDQNSMEVEGPEKEVEAMIEVIDSEDEEVQADAVTMPVFNQEYIWPEVSPGHAARYEAEIQALREQFQGEDNEIDLTMASEYAEDIFAYMNELEDEVMPSATYMDDQNEITWAMRQTLIDWLVQVHLRYHMLPETLWIAVNIIDRFLTRRVVSLEKLQLVGVTAMFIASKYEEVLAPSADEFVFMTENGYSKKEILKGERIILMTLDFKISHYCSPYSWMRKISKADDYDIQTRTLSKFLAEVTLHDHRFLRVKPSMIAAVGMYTARRMLGGDWDASFAYYAGFTEEQVAPGSQLLLEKLTEPEFEKLYVYKKYAHKKFLKAAAFAVDKARELIGIAMCEDI